MADTNKIAAEYLKSPPGAFWEWRDGGDVITWFDGTTIAFRPELELLLTRLAPSGLPRFGAILLLLAATRDSWDEPPARLDVLGDLLFSSADTSTDWEFVKHDLAGLERVRRLEPALRASSQAKGVLAELVFEPATNKISGAEAVAVTDQLHHGLSEHIVARGDATTIPGAGTRALLRDLADLRTGLARVDSEVLKLRRETGLDQVPRAAEIELPPPDRVRALLNALVKDDELRGLAKLSHHLMAAVTLPRAVADYDELQVGGVSDISNRGPLDRLLISELAHDDLTLAVRVAENEALYLRRESPPRSPPRQRAVLLETGIRTWGVPRMFAAAAALALAATSDRVTEVLVYRARGNDIEPVDLTTRAGLVAHLAALEADLHPGPALDAWRTAMAKLGNPALPVLITSDDVLNDAEFQRALTEHGISPIYVAALHRSGRFRLIEHTARGSKLLREATLDLDSLLAEPTRFVSTLVDRQWARDLPAIFSITPFPLLMPHAVDPKRSWSVEGRGVLALTNDQRLMFWEKRHQGGRQLADDVPRGALWWSSFATRDGTVRAVVGHANPDGLFLLHIDLDRYGCAAQRLDIERGVRTICSHSGVLFALYPRRVLVVDENSGDVVQALDLPVSTRWIRGRFFRALPSQRWYALAYDGRTARLVPVLDDKAIRCPKLLTLFECDGVDGPLGITTMGDLYATSTGALRRVNHGLTGDLAIRDISPDGRRIVMQTTASPFDKSYQRATIDVATLRVDWYHGQSNAIADPDYLKLIRPVNLWHHFTGIRVGANGSLTLTTRKKFYLRIVCHSTTGRIQLQRVADVNKSMEEMAFQPVPTPREVGFRLARATWTDGSEAFLDSRGLLHLRSSNRLIPEISLVLADREISGWCSDGRLFGEPYFIGDGEGASSRVVFESVVQFADLVRWLP